MCFEYKQQEIEYFNFIKISKLLKCTKGMDTSQQFEQTTTGNGIFYF